MGNKEKTQVGASKTNTNSRRWHCPGWVLALRKSRTSGSLMPPPSRQQLPSPGFVISVDCQAFSIVCDFIVDIRLCQFSERGLSQIVF